MPSGGGEGSRCIEGVHDGCTQASTYFLLSCFSTQLLFLQRGLFDGWVWLQPRHSGSSGGKADSRVRAGRRATMAQTFEMSNSRDGRWRRCTLGDICLRRGNRNVVAAHVVGRGITHPGGTISPNAHSAHASAHFDSGGSAAKTPCPTALPGTGRVSRVHYVCPRVGRFRPG